MDVNLFSFANVDKGLGSCVSGSFPDRDRDILGDPASLPGSTRTPGKSRVPRPRAGHHCVLSLAAKRIMDFFWIKLAARLHSVMFYLDPSKALLSIIYDLLPAEG